MIEKDIQKKIEYYLHRDRSKLYITPYRSWGAMLVVLTLMLLAAFVFGYNAYVQYYIHGVEVEKSTEAAVEKSEIEVLKAEVDDALIYFLEKKKMHEMLRENRIDFYTATSGLQVSDEPAEDISDDEVSDEDVEMSARFDVVRDQVAQVGSVVRSFLIDLVR
jgi:hypothetical protein